MKHKWKGPITMDHLQHFQSTTSFEYNNPNQYMSYIDICEPNFWYFGSFTIGL